MAPFFRSSKPKQSEPALTKSAYKAAIRQNYTHWILRSLSGYLLHPDISYPADAAVADLACGTGIWLQELSEVLPSSAQLVGYDITPAQFPAPEFLASNVVLAEHDCLNPFPQSSQGRYDIVNVRLVKTFLDDDRADVFFKHATSLLKPGGYLQYFAALDCSRIFKGRPTVETPAHTELTRVSAKQDKQDWQTSVPELLALNNLEVVKHEHIPYREPWRQAWGYCILLGIEDIAATSPPDKAKTLINYADQLAEEVDKGVMYDMDLICIVARRNA